MKRGGVGWVVIKELKEIKRETKKRSKKLFMTLKHLKMPYKLQVHVRIEVTT
jgi:hypothetical protein